MICLAVSVLAQAAIGIGVALVLLAVTAIITNYVAEVLI